ncbi:outer dynein arm-docking complex subunit 4-like [Bolinopsis microptera]|uniref:outer dynein arm-docking complex subunit 4-like n=1 Tax=Bolinopsis microptera TaxID=2820187 RepID=UPI0030790A45
MAYSVEEEEGPKCSFSIYLAEGDALAKQGDFVKAINAYSIALDIQPDDKNCLVARSKCHLKLGDADSALKDAESCLKDTNDFTKGLFQKAEALYAMGDFEFALVHYHRGNKLRPELNEFRLGIQKAREAIDNSIGNPNTVKLTSKGDLSYFYKYLDEKAGKKGKPAARKKPQPRAPFSSKVNNEKENTKSLAGDKTVKQLLGELYEDREYLEKLLNDSRATKQSDNTIKSLVSNGINYLDSRLDFWRQQQPLYSRKKKRIDQGNRNRLIKGIGSDPTNYVLRNLDDIDAALADGKASDSLQLARACLKKVKQIDNLPNKKEFVANLHSSIGCALLEMGSLDPALKEHKEDLTISNSIKSEEGKARALDNIGRTYARKGDYSEAVKYWEQRIPMPKTVLEAAWLYHELGRCCLELGRFSEAATYGEQSLDSATQANDDNWQINSSVLIAQAEVKLAHDEKALENFDRALKIAEVLDDKAVQDAISKAIQDVNYRIADNLRKGIVPEETVEALTHEEREPAPPAKAPTPKVPTPAPTPKEATPPATPKESASKEATPPTTPKKPTPPATPKEATPPTTPKKPTPPATPKESAKAPAEATPAPKEPTPAPKEPTPAPKEPTPAPKEPTPAPKTEEVKPATPAAVTPAKSATPVAAKPATPAAATPAKSATPADAKPATPAAAKPATPAAAKPATPAEAKSATPAAAKPATPAEAKSATPAAAKPATPAAAKPATPAAVTPAKSATPVAAKPATPAAATPAKSATPADAKPATPAAAKPTTPVEAKPATPAAAKSATPAAAKSATPADAKPATPAAAKPATPAEAKPATPAAAKPATPAAVKPATPAKSVTPAAPTS